MRGDLPVRADWESASLTSRWNLQVGGTTVWHQYLKEITPDLARQYSFATSSGRRDRHQLNFFQRLGR